MFSSTGLCLGYVDVYPVLERLKKGCWAMLAAIALGVIIWGMLSPRGRIDSKSYRDTPFELPSSN